MTLGGGVRHNLSDNPSGGDDSRTIFRGDESRIILRERRLAGAASEFVTVRGCGEAKSLTARFPQDRKLQRTQRPATGVTRVAQMRRFNPIRVR